MNLREIIVDWLTASRYVKWLEMRHIEQRQDFTAQLADKSEQIKLLRVEIASLKLECDRLRTGAGATQVRSTVKPPVLPAFSGPDDWQAELNKLYDEEKANGISGNGRETVHEPSTDDGA